MSSEADIKNRLEDFNLDSKLPCLSYMTYPMAWIPFVLIILLFNTCAGHPTFAPVRKLSISVLGSEMNLYSLLFAAILIQIGESFVVRWA